MTLAYISENISRSSFSPNRMYDCSEEGREGRKIGRERERGSILYVCIDTHARKGWKFYPLI